jgi:DNA-binding response OmpR family regulator
MADIMIIDDNPELRQILTDFLEADSHSVISARDGSTAREILPTIKPDIVFLDIGLPDTTGLELLPHIKSVHPSTRVIGITGINDYRVEDLLFEAGADQFLLKPFRSRDIISRVRKLLA